MIRWFHVEPQGPVIPTPEAGVCTVYPIAIPVTSGLIHYSSPFNSCNVFQLNDGTSTITASPQNAAYIDDLSGNSKPLLVSETPPSSLYSGNYTDLGGGDVFVVQKPTSYMSYIVDNSWRVGTDFKTMIILIEIDDVTSSLTTRFFGHYILFSNCFYVRCLSSNLSVNINNTNLNSTLSPTNNTWFVFSIRVDTDVKLGLDKSYQQVLPSTPTVANTPSYIGSTDNLFARRLEGSIRDVAMYSGYLSDGDTDTMVDYMKAKWGL